MNIDPAAADAVVAAKEIGLFTGQMSANVPYLPLDDVVDGVVAAAVVANSTAEVDGDVPAVAAASSPLSLFMDSPSKASRTCLCMSSTT